MESTEYQIQDQYYNEDYWSDYSYSTGSKEEAKDMVKSLRRNSASYKFRVVRIKKKVMDW